MKTFSSIIGVLLLIPLIIILISFFSGVGAMIIGWAFPFAIDTVRELTGVYLTDFQIGVTLGFVGSFFRSSSVGDSK